MNQTITFVFTIIFLLESFWEVRLFSQLQALAIQNPTRIPPRFGASLELDILDSNHLIIPYFIKFHDFMGKPNHID